MSKKYEKAPGPASPEGIEAFQHANLNPAGCGCAQCKARLAGERDFYTKPRQVGCDWCNGNESDHERGCPKSAPDVLSALARIELCLSPAPWRSDNGNRVYAPMRPEWRVTGGDEEQLLADGKYHGAHADDMNGIAALRNTFPTLLEITRLAREIASDIGCIVQAVQRGKGFNVAPCGGCSVCRLNATLIVLKEKL